MRILHLGFVAILLIAVALAGCTGSGQSTLAAGTGTPGGSGSASGNPVPSGSPATAMASGAQLLGGLTYEWAEYRMVSQSSGEKMTMYFKYNHKTGKCTMRIESASGMSVPEMDCSSTGNAQTGNNPNDISSEVKLTKAGTETVTVPAGTFVADKYTASYGSGTATYWIASGKPLIKMEGGTAEGSAILELNSWG